MGRIRNSISKEEQERIRKGKMKEHIVSVEDEDHSDEDEDEESLDEFEDDGFIVDYDQEDEENPTPTQKKRKRKRKSLKSIVLDDDDLELIRENKILGINQGDGMFKRLKKVAMNTESGEPLFDDGGSQFDDIFEGDEFKSTDVDDDMADFLVDDEAFSGKGDSLREGQPTKPKHTSSMLRGAKSSFDKVGQRFEDRGTHIPMKANAAGQGNNVDDTDIPERMQIFEEIVGSFQLEKISTEEETSWILSQLATDIYPLFSEKGGEGKSLRPLDAIKREDILRFLELHHVKKYDIPFIAMYRKEHCLSLLENPEEDDANMDENENAVERKPTLKLHKVLWMIKELDKKWFLLQKRKSTLMSYYEQRFDEELANSSFKKDLFEYLTNMLKEAQLEREIDDVDIKFNLHFPPVDQLFDSGYRRPLKKSFYTNCFKAGLWSLGSKFCNPEKFGLSITLDKVPMEIQDDPKESPEDVASMYICKMFETSEAVLKGARHMAAVHISSNISFRKHVRSIFMDKALVSTTPTLGGNKVIDSFHQFAGVKWLQNKPLQKFVDAQWLFIQKAEEENLLQVKIKLPDDVLKELTMICNDHFLQDGQGTSGQLWNEQRKLVLQDAVTNYILPSMEKEARAFLTAMAKNWLLLDYARLFWDRVSVAPFQLKDNVTAAKKGVTGEKMGHESKVMACCWGPGKPGTAFVMLDSKGELVDVLHAGSLTLRSQNVNDQQRRNNDLQRVLRFLSYHQPRVIVLGAANATCIRLREDITEIISMLVDEKSEDGSQEIKAMPTVVLGEEGLPRLYEDAEISKDQLPRQQGIVKRAVALGRYLLNPLAMVATLCGANKEILSWKLTPLEQFLTSDEKFEIIEWVMVHITNQVGIDINLAISHDWLFAPLQFVSGLGLRKAGILCRELLRGTAVRNRRDLTKCGLNTKKVFFNAVGFLQISCDDPIFTDAVANVLDATRIHPESYCLAEELARAAYKHYFQEDLAATQVNVFEFILDDPKVLEGFDLNNYADRLESEKGEHKRQTLYDIKMELIDGFKDPRRPYAEPTQDEEFLMIAGETGDLAVEGRRVEATVSHVQSKLAFCLLDSGLTRLTGVLFKEDFSDENEDIPLTRNLHEGVVLTCKIKLVDKTKYRVVLTCKASELNSEGDQSFHDKDPYFCEGKITLPSQADEGDKGRTTNKPFQQRMIFHPQFQNITADQAKEFLADKAVGEYIFHPSSRGPCYLTLTLKIFDGLYVHKDIAEGGKDQDKQGLLGLGRILKIGEEFYENIDKMVEKFVNPLVNHLKAMLNFRKFKRGSKAEVDEQLKVEKEEYPKRIAYGFGISYEHPGTFILSYIRSTNPHHEFIGILPRGFKFRKQIFENMEQLVAYFQKHINDIVLPAKNADQRKQFTGHNIRGDDCGHGRGHVHGRGRGRGCGRGRGRGRGRMSGTCDDSVDNGSYQNNDGGDFTSSKWSSDSKNWNLGDNGGSSYHGAQDSPKQWRTGYNDPRDKDKEADKDHGWENGQGQGSGGGWSNANSSNWRRNSGKGWGEGGSTNFSHESDMDAAGGNQGFSNDCAWEKERGRGRGRSQSDYQGRDENSCGGGWGNTRNDDTGDEGGGWVNAGSANWVGNSSKSWDQGGPGKRGENGMQGCGSSQDDSSWGRGGWERGRGWNQDGEQERGLGCDESSSGDGWGNTRNDDTGGDGGCWAKANSSNWGGNKSESWGHDGPDEGKDSGGGWGNTRDDDTDGDGGGWTKANSSSDWGGNRSRSWGQDGPDQGKNSGGGWGNTRNDDTGRDGGWTKASSSNWGRNRGKSWGQDGPDQGKNSGGGWGNTRNDDTGGDGNGWAKGTSSNLGGNRSKSWGQDDPDEGKDGVTGNFSYKDSHESGLQGSGRGRGRGRGRGWSQDGWQGRGRGHDENSSVGGWGSSGNDCNAGGGGGWNSSGGGWGSAGNDRNAGGGGGGGGWNSSVGGLGSAGNDHNAGGGGGWAKADSSNWASSSTKSWSQGGGIGQGEKQDRGRGWNQGGGQGSDQDKKYGGWDSAGGDYNGGGDATDSSGWGVNVDSSKTGGCADNENSGWNAGAGKQTTPSASGSRWGGNGVGW